MSPGEIVFVKRFEGFNKDNSPSKAAYLMLGKKNKVSQQTKNNLNGKVHVEYLVVVNSTK